MKKIVYSTIIENKEMTDGIFDLRLHAPEIANGTKPGQFVEIYPDDNRHLLPRPLSICEIHREPGEIRIVYQVVGEGTEYFSKLSPQKTLRVLGPLGNGFEIGRENNIALVGGGIGAPPLLELCKELKRRNPAADVRVFLGFRSQPILIADFENLGAVVKIATDEGQVGFRGNAVELISGDEPKIEIIYSCGPKIMLYHLAKWALDKKIQCQVSLEERMACGIGACVGCAVKIKQDNGWIHKKVCKDGPVFKAGEVAWDE